MDTECIIWQGALQSQGYGSVAVGDGSGRSMLAHRKAWIEKHGEIEDGMTVDHLCRVRACVNTDHMEIVTRGENSRRAIAYITHCKQGHPLSGDNVRLQERRDGHPRRVCVECARAAQRRAYHAAKARGENPNAAFVARRSAQRAAARAEKAARLAG